jgi:hypothetical protein
MCGVRGGATAIYALRLRGDSIFIGAASGGDAGFGRRPSLQHYPTVREARERVRTGRTGPLWLLHGTYLQDWLRATSTSSGRSPTTRG